jgi:hypothetical protein
VLIRDPRLAAPTAAPLPAPAPATTASVPSSPTRRISAPSASLRQVQTKKRHYLPSSTVPLAHPHIQFLHHLNPQSQLLPLQFQLLQPLKAKAVPSSASVQTSPIAKAAPTQSSPNTRAVAAHS